MLSPTTCGAPPAAIHSLCAGGTISFGLRSCARKLASTTGRIEFTLWPHDGHGVTAWSFSSRCSPPGVVAPMQLRSDTGLPVSARSGTLTLLSKSALRRTSATVSVAPVGVPPTESDFCTVHPSEKPLRTPLMFGALLASAEYGAEPEEWTAGRISVFVLASGCVPGSVGVARCLWPEAKGICDRGIMPALGVRPRRRAIRRDAEWFDRGGRAPRIEGSLSRVEKPALHRRKTAICCKNELRPAEQGAAQKVRTPRGVIKCGCAERGCRLKPAFHCGRNAGFSRQLHTHFQSHPIPRAERHLA
jgi:hypothetical protein